MSTPVLEQRLDQLRTGLEGLLSCFESERSPEPELMDAAWARVLHTFESVRAELDGLDQTARAPHREGLQHCLRLYAVATGVLARRREELAVERSAVSGAKKRMASQRDQSAAGDSCNVRG